VTVWRRLRDWMGGRGEREGPAQRAPDEDGEPASIRGGDPTKSSGRGAPSTPASASSAQAYDDLLAPVAGGAALTEMDVEQRLWRLGTEGVAFDEGEALGLAEQLRGAGREARAIALARRVLAVRPSAARLAVRVASWCASRGDDTTATQLLYPFLHGDEPLLDAWMLGAEIAERRGDDGGALSLYERILARDLDYPRARERVDRLRERAHRRRDLGGATLLADGALTRGRYRLVQELGRGAAGTVFAAEDLHTARIVALKVYHGRGRLERERLRIEARVPAKLEHPGVVRIFDLDEELCALVMERVEAGSIRQELRRGAVPVARAVRWISSAAEALAYVHARGIVHRDLKPSNFLLREDDRVVLTDFGLARASGASDGGLGPLGEGTLAYMPPEQRAGAAAHPSSDVHALGATLRELLGNATGKIPDVLVELAAICTRFDPKQRPDARWVLEQVSATLAELPA